MVGIVSATALACNYTSPAANFIRPWWQFNPGALEFTVFMILLLTSMIVLIGILAKKLTHWLRWDSLHWIAQGVGLLLGCLRGLWWSGLLILILLATNLTYFTNSIEERSVLGPHLAKVAKTTLEVVSNRYPGAINRKALIPPLEL